MEVQLKRGPSISMFFALFCFFLPFVTLSCPGGSFSFSGLELATGTTVNEAEMLGKNSEQKIPAESLATGALCLTIVAAFVSLASSRGPRIATGAIGVVNFFLLLVLKFKVDQDILREGSGMFQTSWGPGFWLALFGYASTAAIVFLILFDEVDRTPAISQEIIDSSLAPSVPSPAESAEFKPGQRDWV